MNKNNEGDKMRKLRIVYDMDDVLNNLNEVVATAVGIKETQLTRYNINEIPELEPGQKKAILSCYRTPSIFKQTKLMPGAERICDVEDSGVADVYIHSISLSPEIIPIKLAKLADGIPRLSPDKISLVLGSGGSDKEAYENTDIVIEDSMANVLKYSNNTIKILINKSHNKAEDWGVAESKLQIIRVNSLVDAVTIVERLVHMYKLGLLQK